MSRSDRLREGLLPWGGVIGSVLGFAIAHQVGSDSVFNDCASASPGAVLVAGIVGLALLAGGALASWSVHSRRGEAAPRKLIAVVSLMLCALVSFAILLPMIASLMIPQCHA